MPFLRTDLKVDSLRGLNKRIRDGIPYARSLVGSLELFRLLQEAFVALIFAGVVLAWSENCHLTEEDSKQLLVRMSQMR